MNGTGIWLAGLCLCWADSVWAAGNPSDGSAYETIVRANDSATGPLATTRSADEARTLPGGFGDALRAVESAPGVARAQLGSGQLVIFGAAPAESRVYIEGIELPALYHLGGLRTVLPTAMVKELTLLPAGYGAAYGRALGGLLLIGERALVDGFHGELSVDLLDAGAQLLATLGPRLRVAAAGRYSYLDRALSAISGQALGDFFPLPRYQDFQVRAQLSLRKDESVTATILGSGDELRRARVQLDAAQAQSETWRRDFYRFGLRYERHPQGGAHLSVTPWVGLDVSDYVARFGDIPARLSRREIRYGLRASYAARIVARLFLSVGVDVLGSVAELSREGTLTRPPREGDRSVFGQSPGREINTDTWSTHIADFAPFLSLGVRLGRLRIEPGLRVAGTLLDVSRLLPRVGAAPPLGGRRMVFSVEPRLVLRYQPAQRLTLVATTGLYHQPPEPTDLSAVFGNPTLGLSRAVHVVVGAEVTLADRVQLEGAGFYRYLDQLVARSPSPTPPLSRLLTQDGTGQSYGGQISVRLSLWRGLSGSVTYSASRSERRDAPTAPVRLADFDQTHLLQASARYVLWGFGFSMRLRFTSGLPRSDVQGAYYDSFGDRYQPIFGVNNGIRLPDFVQLDARVDRDFSFGKGVTLAVQLEVQNVTNHQNAEEIAYRFDFTERDYITGLPTIAVLGIRLSY